MTRTLSSLLSLSLLSCSGVPAQEGAARFGSDDAARFARLALDCVHREYPNKLSHVLRADADAQTPRSLHPAFYGCFDWHSAVHGHWLLARLCRTFPEASFVPAAREALQESLDAQHILGEVRYFDAEGRGSYERPYGIAWLLQLAGELAEWDDPLAETLHQNLAPLERLCRDRFHDWLAKLSHPIRTGEHSQTAFAMGLALDYARGRGDREFAARLEERARSFYGRDRGWSLAFEPGGQDFLSPGLAEADLMRRVLPPADFASWLLRFLPELAAEQGDPGDLWLQPAVVTDKADGKLAHLDGLNLARAWMLEGIADALPPADEALRRRLLGAAEQHRDAGLAAVTGAHYAGGHWLGSFAVYLVTERGLR